MVRIATRSLARLCHNLGTGLYAGLDVGRIWDNECQRASPGSRPHLDLVRVRLADGDSLASSFKHTNGYFPSLFCEMVEVGERTGRLDQVFQRLAEHYEQVLVLRRNFIAGITWPMIELTLGILIIGFLIWVLGAIADGPDAERLAVFGLRGTSGAIVWFSLVGAIAGMIALPIVGVQKGWLDPGPMYRVLLHVPGLGRGLRTISLARLTWALSMATDSDLPPDRSIELAVRSTQNSYYTDMIEQLRLTIRRGGEMHDAFAATGQYPDDFLETIQTGELSGRVSETLKTLSRDYDERAKMWYRGFSLACGLGVFALVAVLMIVMIFQVFQLYLAPINDALQGV